MISCHLFFIMSVVMSNKLATVTEQTTFNEPVINQTLAAVEKSRIQRYLIKIALTSDGKYTATWGESGQYTQTATSVASALRLLANLFETAGLFGSDKERLADLAVKPHCRCKYCDAPIFFAHLPAPSVKFLAFDCTPLDARQVPNLRVATFSKTADPRGRPTIIWHFSGTEGPVYIPHPETCGQRDEPPLSPTLRRLWDQNSEVSLEQQNQMIHKLQNFTREVGNFNGNESTIPGP